MKDNLLVLYSQFKLIYSDRHAGGSAFWCLKCGAEAHSVEGFFPCQNDFVPLKVWCNECQNRWKLEMCDEKDSVRDRETGSDPTLQ